jgi:hypothetical protein
MTIEKEDDVEDFIEQHTKTIGIDEPLIARYLNIVIITALLCKHAMTEEKEEKE